MSNTCGKLFECTSLLCPFTLMYTMQDIRGVIQDELCSFFGKAKSFVVFFALDTILRWKIFLCGKARERTNLNGQTPFIIT